MGDFLSLAARVEKLTGPDRDLDTEVFLALHPEWTVAGGMMGSIVHWDAVHPITASADAVIALIKSELPGWWVQHLGQNRTGWGCRIETQGRSVPNSTWPLSCATPALALLSAFLRAKAAQQQMEADRG